MNKQKIKTLIKRTVILHNIFYKLLNIYYSRGLKVSKHDGVKLKIYNKGENNSFFSDENCFINSLSVRIEGNNNKIIIDKNCEIRSQGQFAICGNNCLIHIKKDVTMTSHCKLEVNEDNQSIIIDEDCMLSNHVLIRTNDSHGIYSRLTGIRINNPASVYIGKHVWLAANTTILKGVHIGNGSIIGYGSIVTKEIPDNCIAVGIPAKVVKEGVEWDRQYRTKT